MGAEAQGWLHAQQRLRTVQAERMRAAAERAAAKRAARPRGPPALAQHSAWADDGTAVEANPKRPRWQRDGVDVRRAGDGSFQASRFFEGLGGARGD
jgi:hypothetical protein